jgi:uncharacterized membrane protein
MNTRDSILRLAITGLLAMGATGAATSALADENGKEQCAGIVKAGKNDCATSTNACHSHATVDASAEAWVYLPKGTCDRLVGGHVIHVQEPAPKK